MITLPQLPDPALDPAQAADLRRAFSALAEALAARPGLDVRHLRDFMTPMAPGTARLAVRCDVSGDPAWTLPLARLAARHAVPATFFLGHREEYFGRDGWLPAFLAAGPELGLKAVPWVAGDPDYAQAAPAVTAAIGWLRDRHVDLRGLAFDPPGFGVAAEGYELLRGQSLAGRTQAAAPDGGTIALQTLDPVALGIGYTTQFVPTRDHFDAASMDGYFAVALAGDIRAMTLRQAAWGSNPMHSWYGFTMLTYAGHGAWLRYDGGSAAPPATHWNVASLLEWIEQTGAGRRYQFILDPRLLDS